MPATENDYPKVECSEIWIRKMRTIFRRLEVDGNGVLQLDNFLDIATRFMSNFPKMEFFKGDAIVEAVTTLWFDLVCNHVEMKQRTHAYVNESMFLDNMKKVINDKFKAAFSSIIDPFFEAADLDNDGKISGMEYRLLMKAWNAPDKDSDLIFKTLDSGHKGKIGKAEFHSAWAEFFFSEAPKTPTLRLFGLLINYKRPEDFAEVECGPVWEGKMRSMFRRLDLQQSNKLRSRDFIQIARSIAQRGHIDKRKADAVMRSMLNLWIRYFSVDEAGNHRAEITEKEFIATMRKIINGDFRHEIDQFGWTFFKAVEVDGNGYISPQEYRCLQEAWKVNREEADGMFKVIDTDKDNLISSDEYLHAFLEFILGENPNTEFRGFFGPVIAKHEAR